MFRRKIGYIYTVDELIFVTTVPIRCGGPKPLRRRKKAILPVKSAAKAYTALETPSRHVCRGSHPLVSRRLNRRKPTTPFNSAGAATKGRRPAVFLHVFANPNRRPRFLRRYVSIRLRRPCRRCASRVLRSALFLFLTAMAMAFFDPTRTSIFFALVIAVYMRFFWSII